MRGNPEGRTRMRSFVTRGGTTKWNDRIGCRLKLYDLHIFLTVAEMGSMGKAAERLTISQPSVSKAIADLEHMIGVRLLNRTARGVQLTPAGRAMFRRGLGAFDELRQGIKDIEFLVDPTAGEVRVGCPEAIASGLLLASLAPFSCKHPRVTVSVFAADDLAHEFRLLRERTIDFLLGEIPTPLAEEDLEAEVLYDERPFIVAGVKNRWAGRRRIELAELVDELWLLPRESIFQMFVAEGFQSKGLALPKLGVRSYSVHQRFNLLATNRFIGAEAGSLLRFNVDRFPLKVLPVDFAVRSFAVGIIQLKSQETSPIVQTFIDCLRDVAKPIRLP
jgi:DNA-binding transcriptional LysR family regulator